MIFSDGEKTVVITEQRDRVELPGYGEVVDQVRVVIYGLKGGKK
ncbi:hypothetical protein GCM10022237_39450 [Nocardioides ginsengisoli]